MTTAYSAFFASGLLATSYYASGYDFTSSTKSNQIRIDETRLVAESASIPTLNPLNTNVKPSISRSPSSTNDASSTSPLSASRHRRRRSSLSAAISMSFTGVKSSTRDAASAAVRCYATLGSSASPQRRPSFSLSKIEMENSTPGSEASVPNSDAQSHKRPKVPRRSTVSAGHAPLRSKRFDRRGPSPVPPPSSPLPPLPSLPIVSSNPQ